MGQSSTTAQQSPAIRGPRESEIARFEVVKTVFESQLCVTNRRYDRQGRFNLAFIVRLEYFWSEVNGNEHITA